MTVAHLDGSWVRAADLLDRLTDRTLFDETVSGCWLWQGGTSTNGYGQLAFQGRQVTVHVVAYEAMVGPLPEGHELDHRCHDTSCGMGPDCPHRRCWRPDHLEPVTHGENVRRGAAATFRVTECCRGHPYDETNTYWYTRSGRPGRGCRECRRDEVRRRRARCR